MAVSKTFNPYGNTPSSYKILDDFEEEVRRAWLGFALHVRRNTSDEQILDLLVSLGLFNSSLNIADKPQELIQKLMKQVPPNYDDPDDIEGDDPLHKYLRTLGHGLEGVAATFYGGWKKSLLRTNQWVKAVLTQNARKITVSGSGIIPFKATKIGNDLNTVMRKHLDYYGKPLEQKNIVQMIEQGIKSGESPLTLARRFRRSIGLSDRQMSWVNNFRRQLETGQIGAARARQLFPTEFNAELNRALARGKPLSKNLINRMEQRYISNMIDMRARAIANTESKRYISKGHDDYIEESIEAGDLDRNSLTQVWRTQLDDRVRDTHRGMEGQVKFSETTRGYLSPSGATLMYPGDFGAPAEEVINCRCREVSQINI